MKELLYLKDDQLKDLIEKLFISYRETFSDSKKILDRYSIGLAHHKVIHLLSIYVSKFARWKFALNIQKGFRETGINKPRKLQNTVHVPFSKCRLHASIIN